MKKILLLATLLLAACGGPAPKCDTLKCHVEATGTMSDAGSPDAPEEAVSTSSALTSEQANSIALGWAYFGGWGSPPTFQFYDPDCSGGWLNAWGTYGANNGKTYWLEESKMLGLSCFYSSQSSYAPFSAFIVGIRSYMHPAPSVSPVYATPMLNHLCYAAVRSWGYDDASATNSCDPTMTPYVENAKNYVHDQLFPGTPFWTWWY